MPRFVSSILPPRPIVQRQSIAAASVQSASDAAVVDEKVIEVAALGGLLANYELRLHALEHPEA
jgi:hypothetical protein